MHKVLIAEDDTVQMVRFIRILEKYRDNFEVITARDGKEAIDVLKQEPVSLVVTDIQMPRMNGLVLLAYVHTYHPNIPCIVITAYGTARLKYKLPRDILRIFQKPFDVNDLAYAIMAALEQKDASGDVQGISIVSFLNLIEMEQNSCIFEIKPQNKSAGAMYFENGILYDAEFGDLTGEAAALELISAKIESYRFKSIPQEKGPRRIKAELSDLIRNALGFASEDEAW
ncbi:MAG: response regulator [Proteobacteria bacterium]|nr:response regulator [Pseudomonadota bacterium]